MSSIDISVVVPVYNEEKNIKPLFSRLKTVLSKLNIYFEVIFVNDGSRDNSILEIKLLSLEDNRVKYINFSRNFGHQIAVSAGIDFAKGNSIVIIDADLQDPPEAIEDLYLKYKEGYEVVYARRKKRDGESFFKRYTAKLFYRILRSITSIQIPVDTGDFRIIDRKVATVLKNMREANKFLRGQIAWIGFRQTSIEYNREQRLSGASGYSVSKMFKLAIDGITSFSDIPLRLVTITGFVVSFIAFLIFLYAMYSRFILKDYVQGWTSIMVSIVFLGGIQLIAIGIIGEYLSRISANVKNRPLYVVAESNVEKDEKILFDTPHA